MSATTPASGHQCVTLRVDHDTRSSAGLTHDVEAVRLRLYRITVELRDLIAGTPGQRRGCGYSWTRYEEDRRDRLERCAEHGAPRGPRKRGVLVSDSEEIPPSRRQIQQAVQKGLVLGPDAVGQILRFLRQRRGISAGDFSRFRQEYTAAFEDLMRAQLSIALREPDDRSS